MEDEIKKEKRIPRKWTCICIRQGNKPVITDIIEAKSKIEAEHIFKRKYRIFNAFNIELIEIKRCECCNQEGIKCNILLSEHIKCPYCTKLLHEKEAKLGYCCDINKIQHNILDYCVICNKPLSGSLEEFIDRGNWCMACNAEAERNKVFNSPNRNEKKSSKAYLEANEDKDEPLLLDISEE